MNFTEIRIEAPEESKDALMNHLIELGSLGLFETDSEIIAYFDDLKPSYEICRDMENFRHILKSLDFDSDFILDCRVLPDRDWNEEWKKGFTPIDVGENLCIVPSWLTHDTSKIPIIIDPGMVFGTGHHETTRTCLCLLEKMAKHCPGGSLLDIGTGTGILAIGASRLGFKRIMAVDIDPLSVDAAIRNSIANNLNNIEIREGDVHTVNETFDVITANLLSEILTGISAEISSRLKARGVALLSGILTGQEEGVIHAMTAAGLRLEERVADGKWISLVMTNTDS